MTSLKTLSQAEMASSLSHSPVLPVKCIRSGGYLSCTAGFSGLHLADFLGCSYPTRQSPLNATHRSQPSVQVSPHNGPIWPVQRPGRRRGSGPLYEPLPSMVSGAGRGRWAGCETSLQRGPTHRARAAALPTRRDTAAATHHGPLPLNGTPPVAPRHKASTGKRGESQPPPLKTPFNGRYLCWRYITAAGFWSLHKREQAREARRRTAAGGVTVPVRPSPLLDSGGNRAKPP